jgi:hypothetical protein
MGSKLVSAEVSSPLMNIFSGETGLGAALTNPTELAKLKGGISSSYPVLIESRRFPDAEAAYQSLKSGDDALNDILMTAILAHKLIQYPRLLSEITQRGGISFLLQCSHLTNSRKIPRSTWEGVGEISRFIQALVRAYPLALANTPPRVLAQNVLFN